MGFELRGGKKVEWQPIHHGRVAKTLSMLPGQVKRAPRKPTKTRLAKKTSQKEESVKKLVSTLLEDSTSE